MDYRFILDNLNQFAGTGFFVTLLLATLLFLGIYLNKGPKKVMLVWLPAFLLILFFCPIWIVYMKLRSDSQILYRLLWMIPVGMIVCFAMVELVEKLPEKRRSIAFALCVVVIALSGKYVYSNKQFKKAENIYHVPQVVVDICDEIVVPGREVRACVPAEMIQYVRQYTPLVCLTYGRENLVYGEAYSEISNMATLLSEEMLDTSAIAEELRNTDTHYFVVSEGIEMTESMADYGFGFYKNIDGYDIYIADNANLAAHY